MRGPSQHRLPQSPLQVFTLIRVVPLNDDAAEYMRKAYEKFGLMPTSDIRTDVQLPDFLAGWEYFVEK